MKSPILAPAQPNGERSTPPSMKGPSRSDLTAPYVVAVAALGLRSKSARHVPVTQGAGVARVVVEVINSGETKEADRPENRRR